MTPTNQYKLMADAIAYYERAGFRYVETPWAVPHAVARITSPNDECVFSFGSGQALVGSGEQSLLALAEEGKLATGKYQTTTPCFRNEKEDELHQKYFLKNELMVYAPINAEVELEQLLAMCVEYYSHFAQGHKVAVTPSGTLGERDITVNGIEVGSYGILTYSKHTWVYGTGHAEPRMSIAMKLFATQSENSSIP